MNFIYIFLLIITVVLFALLIPAVFKAKSLRKQSSSVKGGESSIQLSVASSKVKFRFRLFLLIGLIDLVVLFVTR
ncbi:hypothetical protein AZI87_04745 [Bdellovibrio bacteriovorus]|uniref:Preprotein translocase subunit SecG n=1 Tax=Bdellovibrio bacteriovorus TaxID=959 RepID=A0A161PE23_BDEBC|nr:hypothetical protein AZI87_04745 [Bdellovibrio bacteriovorus]